MDEQKLDDPLPPKRPRTVGVVYNLKSGKQSVAVDEEAEYDSIDTVDAICAALREGGYVPIPLEAGRDLPATLARGGIDIAFNIAEGHGGRGREAQIPALLDLYDIPFTGSDETTLCVALDKALTKRIVAGEGVRCPASVLLTDGDTRAARPLRFPLIVKPNAEGSSKGISDVSIVETPQALEALVRRSCSVYRESMLAEEYIEGREFTVGLLGNDDALRVFPPMEIRYRKPTQGGYHVYSYSVKQNYREYVEYICPAPLTPRQTQEMTGAARRAFEALGCRDFARADFRMDAQGELYFIEINPLPGLAPGYSDYPMLAEFSGVPYGALVRGVLEAALRRLAAEGCAR
ncbi:MAG: ATP-grasp domain-containing protein [Oscillospiraceae bacterium]|nr:ATP-grasp domain-containing protein [Oscillospiraceae bacterium]